jgi:recombination DNA repair RAD52 pathway protein
MGDNKNILAAMPRQITDIISAPLPGSVIKERSGGGGSVLSYISGQTVTDILNKAFGYMWSWEIVEAKIVESIPYFNRYSKVAEEDKITFNGQRGAWEDQLPVAHVKGRLTLHFLDHNGHATSIVKEGYGSKSIMGKQNDQESIFKAADTDALKKAASRLGIGLELYRDETEAEFFHDLYYVDPWSDEAKVAHAESLAYVTNMMEEFQLSSDEVGNYVKQFSEGVLNGIGDLVPDNIDAFVEYMKALEKQAEAEKQG